MTKTIGVIGLGIMGGAFARNLVADGWRVIGCEVDVARREEARAGGIEIVEGAAAVAEACGDIITSLPTARAVLETARDIAQAKGRARTVIETSTLSLGDKSQVQQILGEAGHTALDCPISGTGSQAKVKDIVVYASGDTAAIARLQPAFLGFARKVMTSAPTSMVAK
jgi:3-hydroxyisobutyrate dehydrogenase-like beta-hydroxyacid dehydrogenase